MYGLQKHSIQVVIKSLKKCGGTHVKNFASSYEFPIENTCFLSRFSFFFLMFLLLLSVLILERFEEEKSKRNERNAYDTFRGAQSLHDSIEQLPTIWLQLFRVMDDVHEGTRQAATSTANVLSKVLHTETHYEQSFHV